MMNRSTAMNSSTMSKSMSAQVKPITLQGSAQIVAQFFRYAVNGILYQRGVYGAETFERREEYGLSLFVSKDKEIAEYFDKITPAVEGWLEKGELKGVSLVVLSSLTGDVMEKWDFEINCVNPKDGDTTISSGKRVGYGRKELGEIQKGMRNVMRQITATVTFLPLLDVRCSFDLRIFLSKRAKVEKKEWKEDKDAEIKNAEVVQLRDFSTSVHRVKATVTYRGDDDDNNDEN